MRRLVWFVLAMFTVVPLFAIPNREPFILNDGPTTITNDGADMLQTTLQARFGSRFLWFRHHGQAYLVRDTDAIRRIEALYEPQRRVGDEQSELGRRQSAIGKEQSEIGRQQSKLGSEQARIDITAADQRERARELTAEMRRLTEQMHERSEAMRALSDRMHVLSAQMRQLGIEARQRTGEILDELVVRGVAEPVG